MGQKHDLSRNSRMNVNVREGYTLHTIHVFKRWNESCVRNIAQSPNLAGLLINIPLKLEKRCNFLSIIWPYVIIKYDILNPLLVVVCSYFCFLFRNSFQYGLVSCGSPSSDLLWGLVDWWALDWTTLLSLLMTIITFLLGFT